MNSALTDEHVDQYLARIGVERRDARERGGAPDNDGGEQSAHGLAPGVCRSQQADRLASWRTTVEAAAVIKRRDS